MTTTYEKYNNIAGYFGWLPIGINKESSKRAILDASDKCSTLRPLLSRELKRMAAWHPTSKISNQLFY